MNSTTDLEKNRIQDFDCGLGTTYERWALNRFFAEKWQSLSIRTVLEGPDDGMTGIYGINSLFLARLGARVTLALSQDDKVAYAKNVWPFYLPEPQNFSIASLNGRNSLAQIPDQFDLVWNFNVINRHANPKSLLFEMCELSSRYVLIFVPNARNYSFFLHRWQHRVSNRPWDHGDPALLTGKPYISWFKEFGFRPKESGFVDCPWWPDIVDPGEFIRDFFPFLKGVASQASPKNRYRWEADALPYYDPIAYSKIHNRMARLAFFEKSPYHWLKGRFAHHIGILAERDAQ